MGMTKKDFELIAHVLKNELIAHGMSSTVVACVAKRIAYTLSGAHINFDLEQFMSVVLGLDQKKKAKKAESQIDGAW